MESILEALAQYGIAGIFLAVLVYCLNKLTDIHKQKKAEWSENSYCNPVLDGLGRWVISLDETDALAVQYEVVEWIAPEIDGLQLE